ncbi:MAG: Rpp14/Pop5 family protein [Candidatus Methanofastidiosia archaeon]
MKVPPTEREKKRFIAFKIIGERKNFKKREVLLEVRRACLRLLGELGTSKTSLWLIDYKEGLGIVRCNTRSVDEVMCSLSTIIQLNKKNVRVEILGVFGTLRTLKGFLNGIHR